MIVFCAALLFVTASFAAIMYCAVHASDQLPVPTNELGSDVRHRPRP